MTIVIDTNILVSALMNPKSDIGTFLMNDLQDHDKISCYKLYIELFDKKEKILKFTNVTESSFLELLFLVLKRIDFINERQILQENWIRANKLIHDIDFKDLNFVALTIQNDAILWTGDKKLLKGLKKKGFNRVVNFDELKRLIKEKG